MVLNKGLVYNGIYRSSEKKIKREKSNKMMADDPQ
jgi:hypothetical protein